LTTLTIQTPRVFKPLLNRARYKAIWGGRGGAKSHFFAESIIERCLIERTFTVCLREIQKSLAQSVKRLLEIKIEALGVGHLFVVQDTQIKCPHGGLIIFQGLQSHTADSIKSLESFDIAWVEEAQTLSQKSLDLLRPTMRKPNSELWFSWNPNLATDPVDALLRSDNPPPDSVVVESQWYDNPFFPDVLKVEMEYDRKRDADKYAHVWLGKYQTNSQARVFKNWRIEEFESKEGALFRLGADWGFSQDPSVLVRCYIDGRNLYIDYEAYMVGCEIDQLPDLFSRVPDSNKYFMTADSARPETISYMRNHGYPKINSAIKGAKSVIEGIEFLKSYDIIVHPRCKHTIDELTMYSFKLDPLTNEVTNILEDKHNHVIDALRYALEGARKATKEHVYTYQPTRGSGSWMG